MSGKLQIALLQEVAKTQATSTTLVITVAATRIGSRLIVSFANDGTPTIGITGGGTWAEDEPTGQAHLSSRTWSCLCTSSVTSVTITWSVSQANAVAHFSEWAGVAPSPVDTKGNSVGGASTAPAVGPFTPTVAQCLVYAFMAHRGTYSAGPTNGFTGMLEAKLGTVAVRPAYLIQTGAAAAASTGWTISSANWDTALVCYRPDDMPARPLSSPGLLPW